MQSPPLARWMDLRLGDGKKMDSDYGGWLPIRQSREPYPSYLADPADCQSVLGELRSIRLTLKKCRL